MTHIPKRSLRILGKAILLFIVFNYAFTCVPEAALWRLSVYNTILPGQTRFPLENDLDLMFSTHEIAASGTRNNEYKVVVLGDSSTWGFLLNSNQTYSSVINTSGVLTCKKQTVHIYNLGYVSLSVFKDLIILQRAVSYKPDLIIWNVTLNSMLRKSEQSVIAKNNRELAQDLIHKYGLAIEIDPVKGPEPHNTSFLDQRDQIARFIKYQLDGIRSQAAGESSDNRYTPLGMDVKADDSFDGIPTPALSPDLLLFDVLNAGVSIAGDIPVIILNEPIQIVNGKNSEIRYNKNYPRWVYDQYREMMAARSKQYHWNYMDLWNTIPPTEFSNTPVHHTATGEKIFSQAIKDIVLESACP
jgi:hypothetical protein